MLKDTNNEKKMIYVASGRSFSSKEPPRKIKEVVGSFRNEGFKVTFIGGKDFKNHQNQTTNLVVKRTIFGSIPFIKNSVSEFLDIIHDYKLLRKLENEYENEKPQLIWERSSRLHISGLKFAKKHNLPYILEWKDNLISLYRFSLFKPMAKFIENYKVKNADFIVVESKKLAREISENEIIDKAKVLVAINAVNLENFKISETFNKNKIRSELKIEEDVLLVTYVGSYAWYHNTPIIIKAAKELNDNHESSKIVFLMVGDGPDRLKCIELSKELQVEDKFVFLGKVDLDKVPEILQSSDVGVLPDCLDIISPIKVQEYMAMHLPTIVPDYEANREIIQNEVNGLLFEPKSYEDLSYKIQYLYDNEKKRKDLGKKARSTIEDKFTWEKTWVSTLNKIYSAINL